MYDRFALVYDELMDEVPYEKWAELIHGLILKYGVSKPVRKRDGQKIKNEEVFEEDSIIHIEGLDNKALIEERDLVLDLCCGSGTLTELMYDMGYDMIGVDVSQDMLNRAYEKKDVSGSDILYLNQDMRELDLYSTVGTVYCFCDRINYLLTDEDILKTFSLIKNYLFPGGIFIFDFNTDYKYREILGDRTIAEKRDDVSFIWDNYYDKEARINEYELTLFIKDEKSGQYDRVDEEHIQRGFCPKEMESLLSEEGFKIIKLMDEETGEKQDMHSQRIIVTASVAKDQA